MPLHARRPGPASPRRYTGSAIRAQAGTHREEPRPAGSEAFSLEFALAERRVLPDEIGRGPLGGRDPQGGGGPLSGTERKNPGRALAAEGRPRGSDTASQNARETAQRKSHKDAFTS